jgi:hypothetical protein
MLSYGVVELLPLPMEQKSLEFCLLAPFQARGAEIRKLREWNLACVFKKHLVHCLCSRFSLGGMVFQFMHRGAKVSVASPFQVIVLGLEMTVEARRYYMG